MPVQQAAESGTISDPMTLGHTCGNEEDGPFRLSVSCCFSLLLVFPSARISFLDLAHLYLFSCSRSFLLCHASRGSPTNPPAHQTSSRLHLLRLHLLHWDP